MKDKTASIAGCLGSYLNAAVGIGGLAATADAAIVQLDISSIDGVNAGLSNEQAISVDLGDLHAGLAGTFHVANSYYGATGIYNRGTTGALIAAGNGAATPTDFASGSLIGAGAPLADSKYPSLFRKGSTLSPDFGPGSYMGFKSANGHYGWLEVTWDSASGNFEILSGAYENVAGAAIQAGALSTVPEPAGVLGSIALLSGGMFFRRRKLAA